MEFTYCVVSGMHFLNPFTITSSIKKLKTGVDASMRVKITGSNELTPYSGSPLAKTGKASDVDFFKQLSSSDLHLVMNGTAKDNHQHTFFMFYS